MRHTIAVCVTLLLATGFASAQDAAKPASTSKAATAPASMPAFSLPNWPPKGMDQYGGTTAIKGKKTGFFHMEKLGHRWMWIDPEGNGFVPLGVSCTISYFGQWSSGNKTDNGMTWDQVTMKKYGSKEAWAAATVKRFRDWGFNYAGEYSYGALRDAGVPYMQQVLLTTGAIDERWAVAGNLWYKTGYNYNLPDVFNPAVATFVQKTAAKAARPDDPLLMYYNVDEGDRLKGFSVTHPKLGLAILCGEMEIQCTPGPPAPKGTKPATQTKPAEKVAATQPSKADKFFPNYTKLAFIDLLKNKYKTIDALNKAWGTDFADFDALKAVRYDRAKWGDYLDPQRKNYPAFREDLDAATEMYVEYYTRLTKDALRKVDPNHAISHEVYGERINPPVAAGFLKGGGYDLYLGVGSPEDYQLLKRPFQPFYFLYANDDSPLRFRGTIDRWITTKDGMGNSDENDPNGGYLKIWDNNANFWYKLQRGGGSGVNLSIKPVDLPDIKWQLWTTGKDADGKSWFTVRPGGRGPGEGPEAAGIAQKWVAAFEQLKQQGKEITYKRINTRDNQVDTQEERGKAWAQKVDRLLNLTDPVSGDYIISGQEWWCWVDANYSFWKEQFNEGLVSLKDNAYDGKEATRLGADGKARTWDDEERDYGDCITDVKKANLSLYEKIIAQQKSAAAATRP